jgi:hypothetical protein
MDYQSNTKHTYKHLVCPTSDNASSGSNIVMLHSSDYFHSTTINYIAADVNVEEVELKSTPCFSIHIGCCMRLNSAGSLPESVFGTTFGNTLMRSRNDV